LWSPLEALVMGGLVMNPFGAAVVADLCSAIGDLIDDDPKLAAKVARKLGSTLTSRLEVSDRRAAEEMKISAMRAAHGKSEF
jgi:hypothetical protein